MAARAAAQAPAADLEPCPDYVMSDRFQSWLVESMRTEVLGQVEAAGLDRMAVIKAPSQEDEEEE